VKSCTNYLTAFIIVRPRRCLVAPFSSRIPCTTPRSTAQPNPSCPGTATRAAAVRTHGRPAAISALGSKFLRRRTTGDGNSKSSWPSASTFLSSAVAGVSPHASASFC